ncbi:MAG: HAMP domain-containing histidine kinase [Ignavibacteria bacterium]|nr:HAMP domain-containing histidine kinase [Ignavibacteria bacterium]
MKYTLNKIQFKSLILFSLFADFYYAQIPEKSDFSEKSYILIFLFIVVALLLLLVLFQNKKNNTLKKLLKLNLTEEYENLRHSYNSLKTSLQNEQNKNELLIQKIKEFETNISQLEEINSTLLEQKIKLQTSKQNLEELQKQKDELFAIAIHDIKNPASAIKGYIDLIKGYDLNATEQQEIIENLATSSDQVVKLAHEISKIMARQKPEETMKFEMTSIKNIIDNICIQNASYAKKKGVKLLNQSSNSLPKNNIDPDKITEAIENLVNNAIKYALPNTIVHVRTYFNSDNVTVEVSDNGVGLSEEDVKKAFNKGVILTPKPTAGEDSSGLGLWIVKKIIEDHNGKVFIKSKLGIGSTFSFQLPIIKE